MDGNSAKSPDPYWELPWKCSLTHKYNQSHFSKHSTKGDMKSYIQLDKKLSEKMLMLILVRDVYKYNKQLSFAIVSLSDSEREKKVVEVFPSQISRERLRYQAS